MSGPRYIGIDSAEFPYADIRVTGRVSYCATTFSSSMSNDTGCPPDSKYAVLELKLSRKELSSKFEQQYVIHIDNLDGHAQESPSWMAVRSCLLSQLASFGYFFFLRGEALFSRTTAHSGACVRSPRLFNLSHTVEES